MLKRSIIIGLFFCLIIIPCLAYNDWAATIYSDGGEGSAGVKYIGGGSLFAKVEYNNNNPALYFHHYILYIYDCGTTIGTWDMGTSATHSPQLHIELNAIEQSDNSLLVYYTIEGAKTASGTWTANYNYRPNYNPVEFELSGWTCDYSGVDPTPSPTPTPAPGWLTANTSICHHAIIEGQPPSGTNFSYHATLYFFGTAIGNRIQEFWTTRDPFYWDFNGAPGTTYYIDVEATGTEYHKTNGTFKIRSCSNLSPNGTLVPGITPTGGWPTYGPTQPRPGYTTMPTGTQPSGAPTSGPTLNPLPVIPTTMMPIWDVTVPIPVRTPGFWSTPEDQPINPIDTIITIIEDIIDIFNNLPDNLWDIFNYPDRDDLLNLVNSTLIPDSILEDYFNFWDQILNPIIEALHFILGILEIPLELLNTVLEYLKEVLDGVFNEIMNILKGAEFFFKWIFYIIPEPLLWTGLALMILILIMKVLHS